MKKTILILLAALCLACVFTMLAACDNDHEFGDWIAEQAATCTEPGVQGHYHCAHCNKDFDRQGNELTDLAIAKLGHDPVETQPHEATCTQPGYTAGTICDRCGELITAQKTTDPLGHQPVLVEGVEVTCTTDGTTDCFECERCHKFSATEDGDFTSDSKEDVQTVVTHIGHVYGEWIPVRGATCTEAGEQKRFCDNCDHEDVASIDKIAHAGILISGTPATCTDSGVADCYQCSMCKKYSQTETGEYAIEQLADAQTTLPAKGHDYESMQWQVVQEPTCQQFGQRERQCANGCGVSQVENVEMKQHSYDNNWQVVKAATCKQQGESKRTCTTCKAELGEPATETRIDPVNETAHTPLEVKGTPATCTTSGMSDGQICSECGVQLQAQNYIEPLGHDETTLVYTQSQDNKFEHHTVKCSREGCLGEEQPCQITVTDERKNCEEQGTSTRTCALCHYTKTETLQPGTHTWDEGQITKPATCGADGEMTYTCQHCSETRKGVINVRPPHQTDGEWKTSDGNHYHECTECHAHLDEASHVKLDGWLSDGDNHWRQCEVCFARLDVAEHGKQTLDKVEAGCEQNGWTEGVKCPTCDYVVTAQKEIPAKQHSYGAWQQDDERVGQHKAVCDNCGNVTWAACAYDRTTHDATCTEAGYILDVCSVCHDEVRQETQGALNHQYGNWIQAVADEGSPDHIHGHYRDCLRCGAEDARQQARCDLQLDKTVDATCTTAGYNLYVCKDCQAEHEEVTDNATGHTLVYTQRWTSAVSGRHYATCGNCDYTTDETDCIIFAETVQATCDQNRYTSYKCIVCQNSRNISEAGTALGHNYGKWEFCGTEDNPEHKRVCTRENCHAEEVKPCNMKSTETLPTCEAAGSISEVCQDCFNGFTKQGEASFGHSWTAWRPTDDGSRCFQKCNNCGQVEEHDHEFETQSKTEPDCEQLGMEVKQCKYCQKRTETTWGELTKHEWQLESMNPASHKARCVKCQKESEGQHDWADSNLCAVCGYDGLEYTLSGVHCIVKNDNKVSNAKHIIIAEKHRELLENGQYDVNEYTVTEIGDGAFTGNTRIETLQFPSTVHTIRYLAFSYCRNLRNVTVTGENHQLTTIGDYAFNGCGALVTFDPPETLTTLGDYAFADCTSLVNIQIGDNLTEIGRGAFMNTGYVNNTEHWQDDMLYLGLHLIKVRQTLQDDGTYTNMSVTVRAGTLSIAAAAFADCKTMTHVTLPASIKIVDKDAFLNCESIQQVEFEGDVRQWFEIDFENDYASPLHYGLTSLHIAGAHDQITIPDGVLRIPAGTFRGTTITEIEIPASVIYIGEEAFENCAQLATVTIKGDKVRYIGKDAFKGSAYYDDPDNWDERGVLYVGKYLIEARETLDGEYTVRDNTVTIANDAFKDCKNLNKITLNRELLFVGAGAFEGCDGLRTIVFTETGYNWFCTGVIGRSISVTDQRFQYYKIYTGAWRRQDQAA